MTVCFVRADLQTTFIECGILTVLAVSGVKGSFHLVGFLTSRPPSLCPLPGVVESPTRSLSSSPQN